MKKLALLLGLSVLTNIGLLLYIAFQPHSDQAKYKPAIETPAGVQVDNGPLNIESTTAPNGTTVFNLRELQKVIPGHTREAVRQVLGIPTSLSRGGSGLELWEYKKRGIDPLSQTVNDFFVRFDGQKAVDVVL